MPVARLLLRRVLAVSKRGGEARGRPIQGQAEAPALIHGLAGRDLLHAPRAAACWGGVRARAALLRGHVIGAVGAEAQSWRGG